MIRPCNYLHEGSDLAAAFTGSAHSQATPAIGEL